MKIKNWNAVVLQLERPRDTIFWNAPQKFAKLFLIMTRVQASFNYIIIQGWLPTSAPVKKHHLRSAAWKLQTSEQETRLLGCLIPRKFWPSDLIVIFSFWPLMKAFAYTIWRQWNLNIRYLHLHQIQMVVTFWFTPTTSL